MNPHLMLSENFTIIPPELFDQSHVGRNYEDFQEYLHNLLEALKSNSSLNIFNESFKTIEDFMNLHNTYNESSHQVPTELVVLLSILYGSISLIAVIGNALVMWIVASSRNMHSVTNYFIANLALADIIIGLFSIPFQYNDHI
ncbi:Substance-K receptor [Armadillidium vulgare]|nr:Substance-K receptor [Armadillidium vulgare]